ncbi:MAG: prepilin-type N-terminal cleavage/methylation domain-containing protein [Candidatus Riflebacteria bacterium]|nr:prepilin-type N-terminal cleavage/methylation domain-containing protein [Candidatus Riflebacteria bacterium]MDD3000209.1 prepilin-type N-terminal cleavage/methylation domain-containing protein [Candidatus Riflebacteria bacterium]
MSETAFNRRAFTMIEVVVAVMLIAMAFVPMLNLFKFGSQGTVNNVNEVTATNYASDLVNFVREIQHYKLEEVIKDKIELSGDTKIKDFFTQQLKLNPPPLVEEPFERSIEIKRYDGAPKNWLGAIIAVIKKRQVVNSFLFSVTVTFPRPSKSGKDKVKLFSMVVE